MLEDASVRTKDRIVSELVDKYNSNELLYAASKSLKRDKRFIEAKVVKKVCTKELSTGSLTSEQSLALVLGANLSKESYQHLRNNALQFNSLYPSYHIVKEAKNKCNPENIQVSDYSAEVPLQDLLYHAASRI